MNSTNYGNNIQAYALNKYLRTYYKDYLVETILLKKKDWEDNIVLFYGKESLVKFQLILKKKKKEIVDVKGIDLMDL